MSFNTNETRSRKGKRAVKRRSSKNDAPESSGQRLLDQALDDLARSALDKKDFKLLRLEVLTREQTDEYVGSPRASYRIPYFDFKGKRISYSRVRFLENKRGGFTGKSGSFRYSQPFNSSPHVYLPPYHDWKKIAKDPTIPILITEGEKKAALACKLGLHCIALGGVYGYKSQKRLYDLIPELREFEWAGREVEICYDADVMLKSEVRDALNGLAMTLSQEYTPKSVSFIHLDAETAGNKTGLDDFLKEEGVKSFKRLDRSTYRPNDRINTFNELICFMDSEHRFFDLRNGKFFKNLWELRETFLNYGKELVGPKTEKYSVELWAESKNRRTHNSVIYEPGQPSVTENNDYNLWKPSSIQPVKSTPTKWLEMVHFIMRKEEYTKWFLQWLAYPLQHPGTKLYQAVFVHSPKQGIGKTFIVDPIMEQIYGRSNFQRMKNAAIGSKFNQFAGRVQFAVINEIYLSNFHDRKALMGEVNDMVTRETVTVNAKFQPEVVYNDYCNYYFSSNHGDALVMDRNDRRIFDIEAPSEKMPQAFYDALDHLVRHENYSASILHYLLNKVDLTDFNPRGDAMPTSYKKSSVKLSRGQFEEFIATIKDDPASLMMVNGNMPDMELYRAEDLKRLFLTQNPEGRYMHLTSQKFSRALKEAGITKRTVRTNENAPLMTLYAVLNESKWSERRNRDWADHYMNHSKLFGGKGR